MKIRRERLAMSKRELRSSGEHRRCGFANGAGERRRGARNSVLCCEDCAQGAGATKTRSRYVSLAAVLSLQERIDLLVASHQIIALLQAKDRRLPSVFLCFRLSYTIQCRFSMSFAFYYRSFITISLLLPHLLLTIVIAPSTVTI